MCFILSDTLRAFISVTSLLFSSINTANVATISAGSSSKKKSLVIISVKRISLHSDISEAIIPLTRTVISLLSIYWLSARYLVILSTSWLTKPWRYLMFSSIFSIWVFWSRKVKYFLLNSSKLSMVSFSVSSFWRCFLRWLGFIFSALSFLR